MKSFIQLFLIIHLILACSPITAFRAIAAAGSVAPEEGGFSGIEQRRHAHLSLRIGDLIIPETYQDPLVERLSVVQSSIMKGRIRGRNIATGSILFITEADEIIPVELGHGERPIVFMSGIFNSLPEGIKREEAGIKYADKEGTVLYTFDFSSSRDDIVRYYYDFIVRRDHLGIYRSSTPHKDKPELSGDWHLQSCFWAYFNGSEAAEDEARKGEVEAWLAERGFDREDYEKDYAFNEVVAFFGHSEQALMKFTETNYEALKASTEGKKLKAIILNIVTYMDMCDNCFKTSYIRSRSEFDGVPFVVLVTGLTPHGVARLKYDSRSGEGRGALGKEPIVEVGDEEINITELLSTSDPKLFIRNYRG
jgi:hypothetical protein